MPPFPKDINRVDAYNQKEMKKQVSARGGEGNKVEKTNLKLGVRGVPQTEVGGLRALADGPPWVSFWAAGSQGGDAPSLGEDKQSRKPGIQVDAHLFVSEPRGFLERTAWDTRRSVPSSEHGAFLMTFAGTS